MTSFKTSIVVFSVALLVGIAPFAFAQSADSNGANEPSASSSMKSAGHSAEGAVSHTYHAAKTAAEDTRITSRVKLALHEDKLTHGQDIHVDTYGGVVTLSGTAPSSRIAEHAVAVAKETRGVQQVKNAITVPSRSSMR